MYFQSRTGAHGSHVGVYGPCVHGIVRGMGTVRYTYNLRLVGIPFGVCIHTGACMDICMHVCGCVYMYVDS